MVLSGLIQPMAVMRPKPKTESATAKTHWRKRVLLPMMSTSLMAPMVQK